MHKIIELIIIGVLAAVLVKVISNIKGGGETVSRVIGHVRAMDDLGRVVIPIEYRRILGIKANDEVEFIIIDKELILKKYEGDK